MDERAEAAAKSAASLIDAAARVIRCKREFLEMLTSAILAGGHVLLEDKPGTGKTTAAKTFAALIGGIKFKRIQFTPDLLPYDITGVDIFDSETRSFRFVPGPVLSNIVLADEINRTTPKVQSALLEVMAERQVSIGNTTHKADEPFFVIATQNPVESEGTFPLPQAQLDRFMLKLSIGYPEREAEISILEDNPQQNVLVNLRPVISVEDFLELSRYAGAVHCARVLKEGITDIVRTTREHKAFLLGASPRAALHLLDLSRAFALVKGRDFVSSDDVLRLSPFVLAHRCRLRDERGGADSLIREIAYRFLGN